LEQWADSITAVLDDLGSREAVLVASNAAFATAALFAATHPSRTTALVVLGGYADAGGTPFVQDETRAAAVRMWDNTRPHTNRDRHVLHLRRNHRHSRLTLPNGHPSNREDASAAAFT
jgi:pimeloyl-ACP methyl ester carboxylesterase